jgi:hypothetical protein
MPVLNQFVDKETDEILKKISKQKKLSKVDIVLRILQENVRDYLSD